MPTARPTLAAEPRQITGKAVARLRRQGRLPAVVYGHGVPSSNLSLDAHEFDVLRRRLGANALVDLSVAGEKADPVLVHEVQIHPVHRRPLHVDLFLVRMTEELTVEVPLVPVGTSEAVAVQGGTLIHALEEVRIRALPDHLPQRIEYPIDSLVDFEGTIHVRDLIIPSDVTLLNELDELVARVIPPRIEVEEAPAVEAVEPVEGEEGEGGAAPEGGEVPEGAEAQGGDERKPERKPKG